MLTLALIIIMTVVALPNVITTPNLFLRSVTLSLLASAALSYNVLYVSIIGSGVSLFSGFYEVTSISIVADVFIFLAGSLAILPWAPISVVSETTNAKLYTISPTVPEYGLLVLFTTAGSSFLISSGDLVSMFLSIELQSFGVYILATLYRDSLTATDSGLKYFLLGGLSSCLILLGSALIYSSTGVTSFENLYLLLSVNDSPVTTIALVVMVSGYLFKISAAPFHNWSPDVYDGVPTIVTTWLAVMPKLSILIFLLQLQGGININSSLVLSEYSQFDIWQSTLTIASLLSLIVGTVVGLAQTRIKRLLAYSTISHIGFLLLALSLNTEQGTECYLFYISQYTVTSINAFFVLLALGYVINRNRSTSSTGLDVQYITDLAGQSVTNPFLGFALAACLFSMAGVPPFVGFFAKQSVLYAAVQANSLFLVFVGIVVSVISASYYLKVIRVVHFDQSDSLDSENLTNKTISNLRAFVISTLIITLTLYIFNPSLVLDSASVLALTLYGY